MAGRYFNVSVSAVLILCNDIGGEKAFTCDIVRTFSLWRTIGLRVQTTFKIDDNKVSQDDKRDVSSSLCVYKVFIFTPSQTETRYTRMPFYRHILFTAEA